MPILALKVGKLRDIWSKLRDIWSSLLPSFLWLKSNSQKTGGLLREQDFEKTGTCN